KQERILSHADTMYLKAVGAAAAKLVEGDRSDISKIDLFRRLASEVSSFVIAGALVDTPEEEVQRRISGAAQAFTAELGLSVGTDSAADEAKVREALARVTPDALTRMLKALGATPAEPTFDPDKLREMTAAFTERQLAELEKLEKQWRSLSGSNTQTLVSF